MTIPLWVAFLILYVIITAILAYSASQDKSVYASGCFQFIAWVILTAIYITGFTVWFFMK